MSKYGTLRLEDFGINKNVEAEGLIATPGDNLPASIADAFIAANEQERGLQMIGVRSRIENLTTTLDRIDDTFIQETVSQGKIPIMIMQNKIVLERVSAQIAKTKQFLDRMIELKKDGTPALTPKNLNAARIGSGAPFREIVEIPSSVHITRVDGINGEKLLDIKEPGARDVFLTTKSSRIPKKKRTKIVDKMLKEGKEQIEQWAFGTQVLTMSDLYRLAGNLGELQTYFSQELNQMNEIGAIIEQMRQSGQSAGEIQKVIENYEYAERTEEFGHAIAHLNRSLDLIGNRMKDENNANNRILEDRMPESTPQKVIAEAVKRRGKLGIALRGSIISIPEVVSREYMAVKRRIRS